MYRAILSFAFFACSTLSAWSHEFWIDPVAHEVAPGTEIVAALRVGQGYQGSSYSYLTSKFRRFELYQNGARVPVEGREGDRPAMTQAAPGEGLAVIVHETTDSRLTYDAFEKFESFVRHKDALWTLAAHAERGLPEVGFTELYSRYAKALVAVGVGQGSDQVVGMEVELVADANPYADDMSGGLPVTLYYQGKVLPEAQIEIFEKTGDAVAISTVRTGPEGRALIPVRPGRRYMLDAVILRAIAPSDENHGAVWESLWANMTFAMPAR